MYAGRRENDASESMVERPSLAFWLQGKMHRLDLAGYILGQFLGAIIGAALVIALWGDVPPV